MVLPDSVIRRLDCKSFSILPTISLEQPTSLANSKRVIRIWVHFFSSAHPVHGIGQQVRLLCAPLPLKMLGRRLCVMYLQA